MAIITLTSCGTLGDHFPFLAFGRALVQHGHQVRYAGPRYLQPHAEECGLEFRPARPELDPAHVKSRPDGFDHWAEERGGRPASERDAGEGDLFESSEFENQMADVLDAVRGADMLISSRLRPVGRMVSDLATIPWVTVCVAPWFYPTEGTSAEKGITARESLATQSAAARQFHDQIHQLRQRLGLEPIPAGSESSLYESPRVLLATSPLFGKPAIRPGRDLVQTGFWFHQPPRWEGWQPSEDFARLVTAEPRPLVLAFSSQPVRDPEAVLDAHLLAARSLGRRLIVQSGWAELGSTAFLEACQKGKAALLPEGPQDWVFSQAGAVISHGGAGTVARAIRAGAAQLVEPYGNDQFYNARQVVALGAGAAVNPHRLTPDGLARVLEDKVLKTERREHLRALALEMDSSNALEMACHQVESWLGEGIR